MRAETILKLSYLAVTVALLLLVAPIVIWVFTPKKELSLIVLDKTVPDQDYREHRGLYWILDHFKYRQPDTLLRYRIDEDYYGFHPRPEKRYEVRMIPEDLPPADLVYLADTYGIYDADYFLENTAEERSTLIYGGLWEADLEPVRALLTGGTTLIAEFNTFASPTRRDPGRALRELLGITWSGWIGRYFSELTHGEEIPVWMEENYREQYEEEWSFEGSGFVLVDLSGSLIVLQEGIDVQRDGLMVFTDEEHREELGVLDRIFYPYWFDIVTPVPGVEVLSEYRFDLTPEGAEQLERRGIPVRFPAVLRNRQPEYTAWYFAGDYADSRRIPRLFQIWGLSGFMKFWSVNTRYAPTGFYWKVYVPLMKSILREAAENRAAVSGERD